MTDSQAFIIGIDLGTTNSAVAFSQIDAPKVPIQLFRIPQEGKWSQEETLPLLPSFLYLEEPEGVIIGARAKAQGALTPTRLIVSAKSWLSNAAAHRKEKILPFESVDPKRRLSPVDASAHYLAHIKKMWNRQMAKGNPHLEMEEQTIILTVPASFDAVARALTVEAAAQVGLKHLTLLEEPQAAFYSWLLDHGQAELKEGDSILVCDVGGGTSDFSLIDVISGEKGLELRRMAVGKHLLLGGDNMDHALFHALEKRLSRELSTTQRLSLIAQAREAKEALLNGQKSYSIFLSGEGSQVIGGSTATELTYEEIQELLLEGFFGLYPFEEAIVLKKGSGIRQMGLGYEPDPSITKHLAHFLYQNGRKTSPTHLLFNGGALKPVIFQNRIVEALQRWFPEGGPVHVLKSSSLDLAVARGAAYFGKLRQEKQSCIVGGIPRSYYLEIQTESGEKKALTLLSRGANEGTRLVADQLFFLTPNVPIAFELYHSPTRLADLAGDLVTIDEEEMTPLPPIQTLCKFGKGEQKTALPVRLEIFLTAIGTLELSLLSTSSDHRWKLEFQLNGEGMQKRSLDETFDAASLERAQKEVQNAFAVGAQAKLTILMTSLEQVLGDDRRKWSPSALRGLFDELLTHAEKRYLSSLYESRFWNLAGFFLRPGMGYPLDDFRIKQLWKCILEDLKRPKSEEVDIQLWICYRRVAAGFSKGQQMQLFSELNSKKQKLKGYPYAEWLRALAAMELVENASKVKLGGQLLNKIVSGKGEACDYWAIGRLGARQLFHGSAANVISKEVCETWIQALLKAPAATNPHLSFALAMMARKTGHAALDVSTQLVERLAPHLEGLHLEGSLDLLNHQRELTLSEQERFFGDSLPPGLSLKIELDVSQ